ncbi:hypothetical protein BaRGS_00000036 [Batillaria attramentaria]|uniref:Uncharacterized protein n=1 Tax=Batillaria attramentaria TaxID=370345 RepID=A0ABD0MAN2_9CAEN
MGTPRLMKRYRQKVMGTPRLYEEIYSSDSALQPPTITPALPLHWPHGPGTGWRRRRTESTFHRRGHKMPMTMESEGLRPMMTFKSLNACGGVDQVTMTSTDRPMVESVKTAVYDGVRWSKVKSQHPFCSRDPCTCSPCCSRHPCTVHAARSAVEIHVHAAHAAVEINVHAARAAVQIQVHAARAAVQIHVHAARAHLQSRSTYMQPVLQSRSTYMRLVLQSRIC